MHLLLLLLLLFRHELYSLSFVSFSEFLSRFPVSRMSLQQLSWVFLWPSSLALALDFTGNGPYHVLRYFAFCFVLFRCVVPCCSHYYVIYFTGKVSNLFSRFYELLKEFVICQRFDLSFEKLYCSCYLDTIIDLDNQYVFKSFVYISQQKIRRVEESKYDCKHFKNVSTSNIYCDIEEKWRARARAHTHKHTHTHSVSVCLPVCLFICLSFNLSNYLSIYSNKIFKMNQSQLSDATKI